MQEEFHAEWNTVTSSTDCKQLYGWGTINANVWLPSLIELVGIDTNKFYEPYGCYYSAMQEIPNVTSQNSLYNVDKNGGSQWVWLVSFNQSSGAAEIWRLCGGTTGWLRSPDKAQSVSVWAVTSQTMVSWDQLVTVSHAVHPAVGKFRIVQKYFYKNKIQQKSREYTKQFSTYYISAQSLLCGERRYSALNELSSFSFIFID